MKGPGWPGLNKKEETMFSIKTTFIRASCYSFHVDLVGLLVLALGIDDDYQAREKQRRKKRERAAAEAAKPKRPPCPHP